MRLLNSIFTFFLLVTLSISPVAAAEFRSAENLQVAERTENLYAAGNDVTIVAPVQKDLVVAGENVTVESEIERGILAAGKTVVLKSNFVGASVRAAGQSILLTGTYNEDVVLAGQNIIITDAIINGDLILAAESLQIEGSNVSGKFIGTYESIKGNLEDQVAGGINVKEMEKREKPSSEETFSLLRLPYEFSMLVALIIGIVFLTNRNRLHARSILLNRYFFIDLGIGFLMLIIPAIIIVVSFFLLLFPILLPAGLIAYLSFFLIAPFVPLYTASLIKNSFRLDTPTLALVLITYVSFLVIRLVPGLRVLEIIPFILFLTTTGYAVRLAVRMLMKYFHTVPASGKTPHHKKA